MLPLRHEFADALPELAVPWRAESPPAPRPLLVNDDVARRLDADPDALRTEDGTAFLVGAAVPEGAVPVAQAYAGHQFGGFSPRLGDGRALLLGEVAGPDGTLCDVHLKGSGRTPFSRGGDGKAAVGPVLREYVIGEAMHALGIPTTRALAAVATGEVVHRERDLPGAVLVRVAASHLRVGTFQYAALQDDRELLERLVAVAVERHHPGAADTDPVALGLLRAVVAAQADLVARWMLVGFVHGVMNTDNTTISGETIDYGPCAFMDRFDPATVFSSIDHGGRYAYGNQPGIARWNLARLAETLLPLIDDDPDAAVATATDAVLAFGDRYTAAWTGGMAAKVGLGAPEVPGGGQVPAGEAPPGEEPPEVAVVRDLPAVLAAGGVDHTQFFRALATAVRGDEAPVRALFADPGAWDDWSPGWRRALERSTADQGLDAEDVAAAMDRVNPCFVPRNHLVEAALDAAVDRDDLGPVTELLAVLADPYTERADRSEYARPAPEGSGPYRTFCGT